MILFRYILGDFFRFVMGTITLCLFLFVLFDFIHKSTRYFQKFDPDTAHIILFYLYQLPLQIIQALPIASLLASVVTMVLLSRSNEVTAMRAAGMSPLSIGMPLAIGGMVLSVISLIVGEFIAPYTAKSMRYVEQVLIEGNPENAVNQNTKWLRDGNRLIHFSDYNMQSGSLNGVSIYEMGPNFRPKNLIKATNSTHLKNDEWTLKNVYAYNFHPNGTLALSETRQTQIATIPIEPEKLSQERRKNSELSLMELYSNIKKDRASGVDVTKSEIEMHTKLAFYLASFVVSLIGLRFGYKSERSVETAKGILLAVGVGISYWFFLSAGKAMASNGTIPAIVGAWIANVVILTFCITDVLRIKSS